MNTLNRKIAPNFSQIESIDFPVLNNIVLDNGIEVFILNDGSSQIVKLDLIVEAGGLYASHKLISPLTSQMLNEGTSTKSAHQIAETFDYHGAYFHPSAEKDNALVSLVTLNKHAKELVPLFRELIVDSQFPKHELDSLLVRRRQNFLVESEKTGFIANQSFNAKMFGVNHPYGAVTTESSYGEITSSMLIDFYKRRYQPQNYKLLISGQVNDKLIGLINQTIGKLERNNQQKKELPSCGELQHSVFDFIERDNAVQSTIRMGFHTVTRTHPDYLGLKVLNTILGGYFGSRLMKNIREEKGYTYGIQSMQVALQQLGFTAILADVKADNAADVEIEIKKEIIKLKTVLVSDKELQLVRNFLMGDMLQMFDGSVETSEVLKSSLPFNLDFEYFKKMKQTILTITPKQLMHLANKYYDLDRMVTVVVGKYKS